MKNLSLIIILIILSTSCYAKKVKGIVTIKGKRHEVNLEVPYDKKDRLLIDHIYSGIEVYDPTLSKPVEAQPHYVSRIEFTDSKYGKIILTAIVKKGKRIPVNHYYRVLEEGKISLLRYVNVVKNNAYGNVNFSNIFLYSKSTSLIKVNNNNFKKKMLKEFNTCSGLQSKLTRKWYEFDAMQEVIRYYNQNCL